VLQNGVAIKAPNSGFGGQCPGLNSSNFKLLANAVPSRGLGSSRQRFGPLMGLFDFVIRCAGLG
jgi:hypothetical protein